MWAVCPQSLLESPARAPASITALLGPEHRVFSAASTVCIALWFYQPDLEMGLTASAPSTTAQNAAFLRLESPGILQLNRGWVSALWKSPQIPWGKLTHPHPINHQLRTGWKGRRSITPTDIQQEKGVREVKKGEDFKKSQIKQRTQRCWIPPVLLLMQRA